MISGRLSKNRGFTLIEILVVISIIALLSSVVFVAVQGARDRAIETSVVAQERQIKNALELFYAEHGYYPAESDWEEALKPYINVEAARRPGVSFDYETICGPVDPCQQYVLSGNYTRPGSSNGGGGDDNGQTQNPVIVTLTANPPTGQNTTLTWGSNPPGTCTAINDQSNSGWLGLKDSSGGQSITLSRTTTFVLSCYASGYQTGSGSVTVNFTPPAEPELVTVPDVVGMTVSAAQTTLEAVGLVKSATTEAHNPNIPSGNVISQNPASGESVQPGSFVDLMVSLGPEENDGNWNAVIEVNESPHYREQRLAGRYQDASLTDYYAPLPVFFEGWKSEVPDIKDAVFEWNFGDGSPVMRSGFNAAHVYEIPDLYTATLTIKDRSGNVKSSDSIQINVRSRDGFGQIYYVDAVDGDDSNPGTPAQPWRTADKAFSMLNNWTGTMYRPGDQILFKRGAGQNFFVSQTIGLRRETNISGVNKHGIVVGSYGSGIKPVIINQGGGHVFAATDGGSFDLAHFTIRDIAFNSAVWISSGNPEGRGVNHILFKNLDVVGGGFSLDHNWSGGGGGSRVGGFFFFGNTVRNTPGTQLYFHSNRLALVNNHFDYSGNHIVYGSWVNIGVVYKNIFERPAGGRNAFRVSAASGTFNTPATNVYLKDNIFRGWVDPRINPPGGGPFLDGQRYNWQLVLVGPQTHVDQSISDIVLERNEFWDAETLLSVSVSSGVNVFDNFFSTKNDQTGYVDKMISIGGKHTFDRRPVSNINFYDNVIVSRPTNPLSRTPNIFYVVKCGSPDQPNCPSASWSSNQHENIRFSGNKICWINGEPNFLALSSGVPQNVVSINTNNQIISGLSACQ